MGLSGVTSTWSARDRTQSCLLDNDGEAVAIALEHVAAKILRLEPEDHDRISFDTERVQGVPGEQPTCVTLADRRDRLPWTTTNKPFRFPPMNSPRTAHPAPVPQGFERPADGKQPAKARGGLWCSIRKGMRFPGSGPNYGRGNDRGRGRGGPRGGSSRGRY